MSSGLSAKRLIPTSINSFHARITTMSISSATIFTIKRGDSAITSDVLLEPPPTNLAQPAGKRHTRTWHHLWAWAHASILAKDLVTVSVFLIRVHDDAIKMMSSQRLTPWWSTRTTAVINVKWLLSGDPDTTALSARITIFARNATTAMTMSTPWKK